MGDEVTETRQFSWGQWFRGSCSSALLCVFLTLAAFFGWSFMKIDNAPLWIAVGVLPAVIIAVLAYRKRDGSGFLEGAVTGACVAALWSGWCFGSAAMS